MLESAQQTLPDGKWFRSGHHAVSHGTRRTCVATSSGFAGTSALRQTSVPRLAAETQVPNFISMTSANFVPRVRLRRTELCGAESQAAGSSRQRIALPRGFNP
jgi:hypothetical protein